jgi:glutathione S-transferase
MQELSMPFNEKIFPFVKGSCGEAFRAFPLIGKLPCLHYDELTVWDSLAMIAL